MAEPDRSLLLLPGQRLQRLREEIRDVRAHQFRRLYEQCDWYRHQQPPAEHPTASITYFGFASANLALMYRLTGQRHYLDEARRWIFTAARYPHWGKAHMPDHDLDAGWLSYGLSLGYSWLRDDLDAAEREELEAKLLLQGRRLYEFAVQSEGDWWSSSFWQNHNWICYAGLATVGYALSDDHPEARKWTKRAQENFRTVLELLPEDGSNCEGVVYWRYGVPWIAIYLDVLEQATGEDLFADSPYLRETFWYRLYQAAPNLEEIVDHGDCHDRRSGHSVAFYYKLASKYRIPQAQWLADRVARSGFWREAYESGVKPGVMPEAFLELLWYDPSVPAEGPEGLAPNRYFPDLGLVVARTGWDADATMLSFKAAPGGGHKAWDTAKRLRDEHGWETLNAGHHHPDANSFVLISHDAFLAIDEGYSNQKRAANHNLVLVDGTGFVNEGRYHVYKQLDHSHQARIRHHAAGNGYVYAVGESASMYDPALDVQRVDRHVLFSPLGHTLVLDELEAGSPRTWTWLLHSDHPAEQIDPHTHLVRKAKARVRVSTLLPETATAERGVTDVVANPTSSTPSLEIRRVQQTLRVGAGPSPTARFLTVLQPGSDLEADDGTAELVADDSGVAARMRSAEGEELIAFGGADGVHGLAARGAVAVFGRHGEDRHLVLLDGDAIEADGLRVRSLDTVDCFARWSGRTVDVVVRCETPTELTVSSPRPIDAEHGAGASVRPGAGDEAIVRVPAGEQRLRWRV